jgi:hypothetical protein
MLAGPNTKYILALQLEAAMQSGGTLHNLHTRDEPFGVGCPTANAIGVNLSHSVSFTGEV